MTCIELDRDDRFFKESKSFQNLPGTVPGLHFFIYANKYWLLDWQQSWVRPTWYSQPFPPEVPRKWIGAFCCPFTKPTTLYLYTAWKTPDLKIIKTTWLKSEPIVCGSRIRHCKVNASLLKAYNHFKVSSLFCFVVLLFCFLKNDKKNPEPNFMCLGVAI